MLYNHKDLLAHEKLKQARLKKQLALQQEQVGYVLRYSIFTLTYTILLACHPGTRSIWKTCNVLAPCNTKSSRTNQPWLRASLHQQVYGCLLIVRIAVLLHGNNRHWPLQLVTTLAPLTPVTGSAGVVNHNNTNPWHKQCTYLPGGEMVC